jgi:hypothetical protein
VSDYKTGERPRRPADLVIGGGKELQRSLYALACQQLLPNCQRILARLVYLKDSPNDYVLNDLNGAVEQIGSFVRCAYTMLNRGVAVPGPDAGEKGNDLRLAMAASPSYWRRKNPVFLELADDFSFFWDAP